MLDCTPADLLVPERRADRQPIPAMETEKQVVGGTAISHQPRTGRSGPPLRTSLFDAHGLGPPAAAGTSWDGAGWTAPVARHAGASSRRRRASTADICHRDVAAIDGVCRLCRRQAGLIAGPHNKTRVDLTAAVRTGHQLFIIGTLRPRGGPPPQQDPPAPTGIAPSLATAAAIGFVLLQIGAITVHLTGEDRRIALNAGLTVTAAVAVWLATRL